MDRELTRNDVREIIKRRLREARGNYRIAAELFSRLPDTRVLLIMTFLALVLALYLTAVNR